MLMAESGGMITKDRRRTIIEASGRLQELDEAVRILTDGGEDNEER